MVGLTLRLLQVVEVADMGQLVSAVYEVDDMNARTLAKKQGFLVRFSPASG